MTYKSHLVSVVHRGRFRTEYSVVLSGYGGLKARHVVRESSHAIKAVIDSYLYLRTCWEARKT